MADVPPPARLSGNPASRYLFMLLLGLAIGVLATVMTLRALHARKDHYPESLMHVMQAHTAALKRNVEQNRCSATDTLPHLTTLRHLANDLEPAFPGLRDEPEFGRHASALRAAVDGALASPPLNCAGVQVVANRIGDSCQACHDGFRQ